MGAAITLGDSSSAVATNLGIAIAVGSHSAAHAGTAQTNFFSVAASIANDSEAEALGQGKVAVNRFGTDAKVHACGTDLLAFNTDLLAFNTGNKEHRHRVGAH
ncbi:hypothetical protein MSAR_32230 [Mycolicibacterium sarraceniae]|uniref:Uncharacterized protein n=1 Tax=Mycolicibacterium sarraceniae TaxID=1534348 RepID=A0A7I7SSV8_9MYCO|nr:hypothetical protein MSAR_32230 [Mycolicibacterium sarraceniae]